MSLMNRRTCRFTIVLVPVMLIALSSVMTYAADKAELADAERMLDRADDLFANGSDDLASVELDAAVEKLEAIAKADPKSAKAQALLARAHAGRGDAERADAASARAAELAPKN